MKLGFSDIAMSPRKDGVIRETDWHKSSGDNTFRRQRAELLQACPFAGGREPLGLGQALSTLPLALRGLASLPIDLEATYPEACRRNRIA